MFERFTERARQVVVLAQEEARGLQHHYIGTEHILLGLLREEGLAARVLESLGVTLEAARDQVTRIVGWGEEAIAGQIPFTPRAKKVLELALREAISLGHNHIGTEHILLGLVRENNGVAARILLDFGADSEQIFHEVIRMLSGPGAAPEAGVAVRIGGLQGPEAGWLDGWLWDMLGRLTQEMRRELGRDPDPGDLLLVLACARHTLAGRATREIGVDLDALWATIEKLRQADQHAQQELRSEIESTRAAKEAAIEEQRFEAAAQLRDQERELRERAGGPTMPVAEILREVRRRLGIPAHLEDPPRAPEDS